jgi:transcriptional regulator with XRE-family HTH domain
LEVAMENKALREWARERIKPHHKRGCGRISALAEHLDLSQPAVSKMIDGSSVIKFKYIQKIIDFTGISAEELLPEYYSLFEKNLNDRKGDVVDLINEAKEKAIDAINRISINI